MNMKNIYNNNTTPKKSYIFDNEKLNSSYYSDTTESLKSNVSENFYGYSSEKFPKSYIRSPEGNGKDFTQPIKKDLKENIVNTKNTGENSYTNTTQLKKNEEIVPDIKIELPINEIIEEPANLFFKYLREWIDWSSTSGKHHAAIHAQYVRNSNLYGYLRTFFMIVIFFKIFHNTMIFINNRYPNGYTEKYIQYFNYFRNILYTYPTNLHYRGINYGPRNIIEIRDTIIGIYNSVAPTNPYTRNIFNMVLKSLLISYIMLHFIYLTPGIPSGIIYILDLLKKIS